MLIRQASEHDTKDMVTLSSEKRSFYEKAQPQFWKRVADADKIQAAWFVSLLKDTDHICCVAEVEGQIIGFIIGKVIKAPEVYDPGGLTLLIDDFCVQENNWTSVGTELVQHIKTEAAPQGASQVLVVCGAHDTLKREFLKSVGLSTASEWYVGGIG